MILIISADADAHAREVIARLSTAEVDVTLLDLSRFPAQATLTLDFEGDRARSVGFGAPGAPVDFAQASVIWWRRPQPIRLDPALADPTTRDFALVEAHSALSGLWLTLDAFWINHPTRDDEASRKVYQLQVAQQVGLRIPATCVTNDVERARAFIDRCGIGKTIYKAFAGTEQAWRETRLVKADEVDLLANVRYAPVIFQEYVPAGVDLRITVVGDQLFAAAIHTANTAYEVDFRMVMSSAPFEPAELPPPVADGLRALMRRLGLVYGAIDMRRTPDGEHVFLEINPAGQWLFVEQRTGQPITQALAELMVARARGR